MNSSSIISLSIFLLIAASSISGATAATFTVQNNCDQPVWAAAMPGGGRRLNKGESWTINVAAGTKSGRIWGRTGCNFDGSGRGSCQTGDCGGVLQCQNSGQKPSTLAEYTLNGDGNKDFYDVSLVDGFNLPMEFKPVSNGCSRGIKCAANIIGECPAELRTTGGCKDPCTVFGTNEYCCKSGPQSCGPTRYSKFFKDRCPDAYSYPYDDPSSTFTCPGGTNYRVVFCP